MLDGTWTKGIFLALRRWFLFPQVTPSAAEPGKRAVTLAWSRNAMRDVETAVRTKGIAASVAVWWTAMLGHAGQVATQKGRQANFLKKPVQRLVVVNGKAVAECLKQIAARCMKGLAILQL